MDLVGTVAVVDLEAACELYGRDMLPYPLGRSRPVGSLWLLTRDVEPIEDRLHRGDLEWVRAWVEALVRADVSVECRVRYRDADIPDLRLHGKRSGEAGFLAVQRRDPDVVDAVDVYAVSPGTLAAVITESVGLVGAGGQPRITVAGDAVGLPTPSESFDEYDDFGFPIADDGPRGQDVLAVDEREVVATGTVQSHHEPARDWGVDPERQLLQWVQIRDDGDYLYAPGEAGYAEPLDAAALRDCIDRLIANDLAVLRERRGLG